MEDKKLQDYTEEQEEGHINTRCFGPDCCDNPDPNLGCDPEIDVAG